MCEEPWPLIAQRSFLIDLLVRLVNELAQARASNGGLLPTLLFEDRVCEIGQAHALVLSFDEAHPEIVEAIRAEARLLAKRGPSKDGSKTMH